MKKILVINTKYKTFGGEDANIVDELKLLSKSYIVEYLEYDNTEKIKFFDIISFFTNSNLSSNKKLQKVIDLFKPDIAYVHNTWFKANLGIFKVLKKNNIKILHKIHSFRYDCSRFILSKNHLKDNIYCPACNINRNEVGIFNKYFSNSFLKSLILIIYSKKYFKLLKKFNFKLLMITNFHRKYLINLGIPKSKIYLFFNPIRISPLRTKNSSTDDKYFLYAGRLDTSKGVEELIKAWVELNLEDYKLKIVGDGDLKSYLVNKYKANNIEFLDKVDNNHAQILISESKAVITATRMFEGQPRLLCEASSLGVPSIYPSFGGMNEFFPKNYVYSYKQYDYSDLKLKTLLLVNSVNSSSQGKIVHDYISSKLQEKNLLNLFSKIAFEDDN